MTACVRGHRPSSVVRRPSTALAALLLSGLTLLAPTGLAGQVDRLELKWMRDSEEYRNLAVQIFHAAGQAVRARAGELPGGATWAVIIDVDETVLDNTTYQLERAAYGLPYDTASWNAWVRREHAPALPGVKAFLDAVRAAGGRVAFVSNRHVWVEEATRRNLERLDLWHSNDRLCLRTTDAAYTKRARRGEVRSGEGACGWGQPARVVVYVGDQMGDMPEPGEGEPREFGVNLFLMPNPAYGDWVP